MWLINIQYNITAIRWVMFGYNNPFILLELTNYTNDLIIGQMLKNLPYRTHITIGQSVIYDVQMNELC